MKIAIVGSRNYPKLELVRQYVYGLPPTAVIVTGGARGVDQAAEEAARERGLRVIVIRPRWDVYGRAAGPIRNREIVKHSDMVVAFWDLVSPGTRSSIEFAREMQKPLLIVGPDGEVVNDV